MPTPEIYLKNKEISLDDAPVAPRDSPRECPAQDTIVDKPKETIAQQNSGIPNPSRQLLTSVGQIRSNGTPMSKAPSVPLCRVKTEPIPRVPSASAAGNYRLPKDVKIVCEDFLTKFKRFSCGVNQATNVCDACKKKCQERHPLVRLLIRYAFWSEGFKQWFVIRPYPKGVLRVAFRQCKDFENKKPCTRRECTFAHGPEVSMWTMEREGSEYDLF